MTRPPNHNPSPEEIKEACRKIREGWSERKMRSRAGLPRKPLLRIPVYRDEDLTEIEQEWIEDEREV